MKHLCPTQGFCSSSECMISCQTRVVIEDRRALGKHSTKSPDMLFAELHHKNWPPANIRRREKGKISAK